MQQSVSAQATTNPQAGSTYVHGYKPPASMHTHGCHTPPTAASRATSATRPVRKLPVNKGGTRPTAAQNSAEQHQTHHTRRRTSWKPPGTRCMTLSWEEAAAKKASLAAGEVHLRGEAVWEAKHNRQQGKPVRRERLLVLSSSSGDGSSLAPASAARELLASTQSRAVRSPCLTCPPRRGERRAAA